MCVALVQNKLWISLDFMPLFVQQVGIALNAIMQPEIQCFCFLFSLLGAPIKEKPFIFSGSSERPADILVSIFSLGKDLAVDFAITCPLQHKYLVDSSLISGFACNDYAAEIKCKSYQSRLKAEGIMSLLFLETFGGFSDDTPEFLNKLISGISSRFS